MTATMGVGQNEQLRRYVEKHHIDMIPVGARHGKPWHQAAFWAGANWNVFNVVLGGALVAFVGLTFYWAVIAIAAGTLVGALFIALHATQGPKLGVPQTIQTRGQFGFYGAAFLFPCVLLLNVGFIAAQYVIQAQSAQGVVSSLSVKVWILILAVPAVLIGIFGYRWIHRVMQATNIIVGLSMLVMLVQALRYGSLPATQTTMHAPTIGLFLAGAALLVIDMLSWAPFVSDYTRYLPVNTNGRRLFWSIYLGNVVSTITASTIGAYVIALVGGDDPVGAIGKVSGKWALVILAISLIGSDTLNAYTGAFQVLAFANMWRRFKSVSVAIRVVPFVCVMATGVLIAILGSAHFLSNLSNLLNVLLMIFIPWSAVNLADYFLIRQGNYDVASFFIPDGTYGKVAWRGIVAYAVGLAAEWPFVSQTWLKGPLVDSLGGADISWIVGFFVAGVVYLALVVGASQPGRRARQVPATARN
jgi:nucleobase:cation symporter-1, NCS1 family